MSVCVCVCVYPCKLLYKLHGKSNVSFRLLCMVWMFMQKEGHFYATTMKGWGHNFPSDI